MKIGLLKSIDLGLGCGFLVIHKGDNVTRPCQAGCVGGLVAHDSLCRGEVAGFVCECERDEDRKRHTVTDSGIVVVSKGAVIEERAEVLSLE